MHYSQLLEWRVNPPFWGTSTGFAKNFCPLLVILSDEAGVLHQTFWVFVSHFTLKMPGKYDYFAGHFAWRSRSSSSDIFKICQTCLTWPTDFAKPASTMATSMIHSINLQSLHFFLRHGSIHGIVLQGSFGKKGYLVIEPDIMIAFCNCAHNVWQIFWSSTKKNVWQILKMSRIALTKTCPAESWNAWHLDWHPKNNFRDNLSYHHSFSTCDRCNQGDFDLELWPWCFTTLCNVEGHIICNYITEHCLVICQCDVCVLVIVFQFFRQRYCSKTWTCYNNKGEASWLFPVSQS